MAYDNLHYCRICASPSTDAECGMHEPMNDGSKSSIQFILETLFPTLFNAAQVQYDLSVNWPSKICLECKRRIQEAYNLYELCTDSADRLRKCLTQEPEGDAIVFEVEYIAHGPILQEFVECSDDTHPEPEPSKLVKTRSSGRRKSVPVNQSTNSESNIEDQLDSTGRDATELHEEKCTIFLKDEHTKFSEADETAEAEQDSDLDTLEPAPKRRRGKPKKIITRDPKERKRRLKKDSSGNVENIEELQSKRNVYRCQLCEVSMFSSPTELTEHQKAEHPAQIRPCDKCPKLFVSEQSFQHHQYCHATGRSFFCTFCDKGFQTENLLNSHTRSHMREAKFLCSFCGKGFANKSSLEKHMNFHTDIKSWACSLCPCRFNTKACLLVHQRTHTKTKIYTCSTCGSQFNKHYSMVKHQIIHTGERPFVCEICPMRFVSPYHVKRHMLTHTGEKPYKCDFCDRSFAQSNVLVKHMRTHVGDNPYQCDRCDASFRLLKDLRNHYQEHYQTSDNGTTSSAVTDDKDIRFTSTKILKLRFEKEMAHYGQRYEENNGE